MTFEQRKEDFLRRARALGPPDMDKYFWYHTVDLGDGLITPGQYDYRETVQAFHFPSDLRGKTVLDIGSATGFFAFEFERRGAQVTSVELPSLYDLDRFPGQDVENSIRKIQRMVYPRTPGSLAEYEVEFTPEQLWRFLLDGPFQFCANQLRSKVRRCYSTVYGLTLQKLDAPQPFDLVFAGDVLLHTLHPFQALLAIVPLCKGILVLAQEMPEAHSDLSAMMYVGGDDPDEDHVSWWHPTKLCFMQLLKKFGFCKVEDKGNHRGVLMPSEFPFERTVLHAIR